MIRNFKSKKLERYWLRGDARGLPADQLERINIRLTALDNAATLEQMNVPGWFFRSLSGNMRGRYAIRISGNWRLTFAWDSNGPDAIDVDYEDYH